MNTKKVSAVTAAVVAGLIGVAACSTSSGNSGTATEFKTQASQTTQYEQAQPNPFFKSSAYRDTLQKAETVQAQGLQGTAFFLTMTGHLVFTCTEFGSPVPNTAQLTNPVQPYNAYTPGGSGGGYDYTTLPVGNMDPNGVYSPNASEGTYVMCDTPSGQELHYWEGPVYSVSGPATWDSATQSVKLLGPPTKISVPPPLKKTSTAKK